VSLYEQYKMNAERWAMKEAFDQFFEDAEHYVNIRNDNQFKLEMHYIMDLIWKEQISKTSQIYTND